MAVATLLNAVSANTTGPVVGLGTPYGNLTLSVSTTGTVSALSVVLQGSNDLHNYTGAVPKLAGASVQSLGGAIRSLYPLGTVSSQASFPPSITPSSMGASANRNWIYGR